MGLNPFRAGQCLSTKGKKKSLAELIVSIPFEQGNVFRHAEIYKDVQETASQSLSSRAMSFDRNQAAVKRAEASQSLSSRAMSFDYYP